ncbi:MAG: DeoR family transcriptional regulator [Roseiarcus sp.]|jgi:DeoR family deoxyribose operon repressor
MSTSPLRPERLNTLAKALAEQGVMRLRDAAALLNVSEMTVRRDIAANAGQFAYFGGRILRASDLGAGYLIDREQDKFSAAKAAACAKAASLIAERDTVFIDCGTTTPFLANLLPIDLDITVVCYSLNIAQIVSRKANVRMILLGGAYHPSSATFSGREGLDTLSAIGVNKAFISASGVERARGVSCWNFHEVPIKQKAMSRAVERHLVVDSSKIGKVMAAFFARIEDFDSIITERPTVDV